MLFLKEWNPLWLAFFAGIFTWGFTAFGAAVVFIRNQVSEKLLSIMLGFAAGVMVAASFWSLLNPAIEMSEHMSIPAWVPACTGFLLGCAFLRLADRFLPHLHLGEPLDHAEGVKTKWKRTTLLVLAVTLHNIPEGLAVGVAFGAMGVDPSPASFASAVALALGIGIQNFPEGLAISMPLRASGFSKFKSFMVGQLSGFVEVVAAVVGAIAVVFIQPLLPYALSFAAGAMMFVVVEELIPESQGGKYSDIATLGFIVGFTVMMILDVALG